MNGILKVIVSPIDHEMSLNNIPAGNRGPGHPIQVPNYRQALAKKVPDTYPVTVF